MKRKRWAWRMLPIEYRFGLMCALRKSRGHPERIAWAKYLRNIRNKGRMLIT